MTGSLDVGQNNLISRYTYHDVVVCNTSTHLDEFVIYTKIPFRSLAMPLIHIRGYAYNHQLPVNIMIVYYQYDGNIIQHGVTYLTRFRPKVYISTYNDGTTDYIAISLVQQNAYFLHFTVDYFDKQKGYGEGWRIDANDDSNNSIIPSDNKVECAKNDSMPSFEVNGTTLNISV